MTHESSKEATKRATAKKEEQLEMKLGTASHRLRKEIMFKYIKLAGENFCFRCASEIQSADELSLDHKIDWIDSEFPTELFFDLDNIAFSHLSCNSGSTRRNKNKQGRSQLTEVHNLENC